MSCEEAFDALHGYTFVCPVDATSVTTPQRIVGYGHFRHEAVAVDPEGNVAYLTEDRPDSALYRFVPNDPAAPFTGALQALRVRGLDALVTELARTITTFLETGVHLWDDSLPAIRELRARGIRTAVVSNCDHGTRPVVERLGLTEEADAVVCPLQPPELVAVGVWYDNFGATTDEEVRDCLAASDGLRLS